jgi:hypothetical protein
VTLTGSSTTFSGATSGSVNGSTQTFGGTISNASGGTTTGTFSLGVTTLENGGLGLTGEGSYAPVSVAYTANVYTGQSIWATNGGGSWGSLTGTGSTTFGQNWGTGQGSPGLDPNFTNTDSASFGTALASGSATVTLDGASPYLNAINFNDSNANTSYTIAQGSSGTIHLDSATTATITNSYGNNTISASIELDSNAATSVASGDTLTISGNISQGGDPGMTINGPGTTVLSGSNTYTGGTAVATGGTLFLNNTSGSGAGTGSLTVAPGGTLGGTGSYGTTQAPGAGFSIAGTGTGTGARAQVLVGLSSASDKNTSNQLTLIASGASTIQNANLTFNINDQVKGGIGTDPANSGTELVVGSTAITFGMGVKSTTLTLNIENAGVIAAYTPYVLIAGTDFTAITQYSGLSLGASTGSLSSGLITMITGSGVNGSGNLTLALTGQANTWYGQNSYLFLYQNTTTGADDIEVEVIPEPGTWALLLGGLAMLVFWQRRKSKSRVS